MMDLRENTSCETDLDCDAGNRRGRGRHDYLLYHKRTQLYFSDVGNIFRLFPMAFRRFAELDAIV